MSGPLPLLRWGALGALLGTLFTFSPGLVFMAALVFSVALCFYSFSPASEKRFIVALFVGGFLVRALFSLSLDLSAWAVTGEWPFRLERQASDPALFSPIDHSRSFARVGDSDYYSIRSYHLARYAGGDRDSAAKTSRYNRTYGAHGYLYVTGFFYYLFGFSPVTGKFLTCFFGALIGPMIYLLGKACFNPTIGRWSGLAVAFFPSLILWSATNMKDIPLIFLGVLLLLLFMKLQRSRRISQFLTWFPLFCLVFAAHAAIRSEIYSFFLLAALALSLWLTWRAHRTWFLFSLGLLALGGLLFHQQIRSGISYALFLHMGHERTRPGLPYRFLPEAFYSQGLGQCYSSIGPNLSFLAAILNGVLHYLLEPFPWRTGSGMRLLAIPQLALWYPAVLLACVGICIGLSRRWRQSLFLFLATAAWTLAGALTNGNIGTVFRMRDMVTPFILIFAAVGLWSLLNGPRALAAHLSTGDDAAD